MKSSLILFVAIAVGALFLSGCSGLTGAKASGKLTFENGTAITCDQDGNCTATLPAQQVPVAFAAKQELPPAKIYTPLK